MSPDNFPEEGCFAMFHFLTRGLSASALVVLSVQAAQADLTAQDVWSDWRAYLTGTGYTVTGTEAMAGNTLTVSDVVLSIDLPEEDGAMTLTMGALSFTENGDGTVSVDMPTQMPLRVTGTDGIDGVPFEVLVNYRQSAPTMTVSGDPADMTYTYTAASVGLTLDSLSSDGVAISSDDVRATFTLGNVMGTTRMQAGDLRRYVQTFQTGGLTYDVFFRDPEGTGSFTMAGAADGLEIDGVSDIPGEMDTENMSDMIKAGFGGTGTLTFGPGSSRVNFADGGETFAYESESEGGSLGVGLTRDGLSYDLTQRGVAMNMMGSQIPLPIALTAAEMGFRLAFPTLASDEPQDFRLALKLADFTMSDMIWSIFDPAAQLPRDAATLDIDLSGKAKLLADIFDPAVAAQMETADAPPAELDALSVNALTLRAVGAELTGNGAFTFDNTDLVSFDGMPRPEGVLNLRLVGGNGLLDKLVAMGLLPEGEAMGARMMMGLFAVPGSEPDTLNSKIEINDQGHILANGQRIQ